MNLEEIEIKDFDARFEIKGEVHQNIDTEFEGYISVNDVPDAHDDIATKGMFNEAFQGEGKILPIFWEHMWLRGQPPVGKTTHGEEDQHGCKVKGVIFPTSLGRDIAIGMKGGAIKSLSYGYKTIDSRKEGKYRRLLKVKPVEVSVCNMGVGQFAKITDVKSLAEYHQSLYGLPQALKVLVSPEELEKGARETVKRAQGLFTQLAGDLAALLKDETAESAETNLNSYEGAIARLKDLSKNFSMST